MGRVSMRRSPATAKGQGQRAEKRTQLRLLLSGCAALALVLHHSSSSHASDQQLVACTPLLIISSLSIAAHLLFVLDAMAAMAEVSGDKSAGPVIAITIGGTHVRFGVHRNNRIEVLTDANGDRNIPAAIAFTNSGILYGQEAADQLALDPKNAISSPMRLIGKSLDQLDREFKQDRVIRGIMTPAIEVTLRGKKVKYTAVQLMTLLLNQVKQQATVFLGQAVAGARIATPTESTEKMDDGIMLAAEAAGLKDVKIMDESMRAVSAHRLQKGNGYALVFHCGGYSTSVVLLKATGNSWQSVASESLPGLGGKNIDQRLFAYFCRIFQLRNKFDLSSDKRAVSRLLKAVRSAKISLSTAVEASIAVDNLFHGRISERASSAPNWKTSARTSSSQHRNWWTESSTRQE